MQVAGPDNQFAQPLRVLYVNSLKSFYFALEADYQRLDCLMASLNRFYGSARGAQLTNPSRLQLGRLYAVYCAPYKEWYRARLERLEESSSAADPCLPGDMLFTLVDFGESLRVPGGQLSTVADLARPFCAPPPAALPGRLANVFPRPDMDSQATRLFLSEVYNKQLFGFCLRAPCSSDSNNNSSCSSSSSAVFDSTEAAPSAAKNPAQEPYHLQLFYVPTGLYQTEYHANGVDGCLLKACLVHTRDDHYSAMHLGGARCDYCDDGAGPDAGLDY